jgi:ADP-ribose pyrophosphatase
MAADQHLTEHKVSGEKILQGNFLQVVRDAVWMPDGGQATREYVVHPGAVVIIPMFTDEAGQVRLILERQFRYPLGRVMIEFPAGKVDPGENLWVSAERELREETGYSAGEWAHAGVMHPVPAYSTEFIDIWFARELTRGEQQLDVGEFVEVITATPAELAQWCRDGTVTDAKTLVAALWLQNLLSGVWTLDWQATGTVDGGIIAR